MVYPISSSGARSTRRWVAESSYAEHSVSNVVPLLLGVGCSDEAWYSPLVEVCEIDHRDCDDRSRGRRGRSLSALRSRNMGFEISAERVSTSSLTVAAPRPEGAGRQEWPSSGRARADRGGFGERPPGSGGRRSPEGNRATEQEGKRQGDEAGEAD